MNNNKLHSFILSAAVLFGILPPALSQNLSQRSRIETEYGVKDAVCRYDTKEDIMSDISRAGGEYFVCKVSSDKVTEAPKGYKPVYITHIGRHGARYAISDDIYENLRNVLHNAHKDGKLTESGELLYAQYEKFYPEVAYRGGDLTQKGQQQLREIASDMYAAFPNVFKGQTHAEVLSTMVPRVLLSMTSFMDELRGLDKDFSYTVDAGRIYLPSIEPNGSSNPFRVKTSTTEEAKASAAKLTESLIDPDSFCSRYFTDTDYLESAYGRWKFESDLRTVVVDLQCLDFETEYFENIFTPEELFNIWEVRNYNGYLFMGRSPLTDNRSCENNGAILKDMIEKADRDLASGNIQLSLRFSHDTAILPLVSFMRLDNFGAVVSKPEDVKNWWRSDGIPMASNLQLIFYRSRRNPEILVKVMYNGKEASLPIEEVAPSFYSWNTFKAYYLGLLSGI